MSDYDDDFEDDESVNNDPYRELGDEKKTENTKKKSVADDDKYRELGDEDKEESFSSYETSEDDEDILNLKKKPEPAAPASPPAANNNNKQDAFRELGDEKKEAPITTNNNDAYRELGEEKEKEEKKVVTAAAVSVGNKDTGKTHVQTAADFTDDSSSSSSESYEDPFDQERKSMLSHGVKSPEVPAKKNSTSIGSPTVVPSKNKPVTPISGGGANNENVHQSNVTTVEKLGEDEKTNFYNSTHEAVEEETRAPKKGVPLSLQGAVQNNNNNNKLKSDIRSASYSTKHSSDESEEEEEDSDSSSSSSASSSEKELSPKKQDPPPAADTRELSPKKEEPRITSSSLRKKLEEDVERGRQTYPEEGESPTPKKEQRTPARQSVINNTLDYGGYVGRRKRVVNAAAGEGIDADRFMGNKTDDDDDDGRSTGRSKELTPEEKLRKELNLKIRRLKKEVLEVNNKIDLQNQRMEDKRRLRTLKREQNEKNELKLRRQLKKLRAENEELTKKHIKVFGEDGDADVLSGGVYYFVAQAERQLKREQEKLKETKAAVRELKRKDKRAEHTLEEEHKKRSEQRQQSIVNENIYTRAGADKKIKQLKKSIEQTKITNENFSKKCEELQRQVDDEGCNINVKENAELRKNFEDNEKEITRLRNAIHVYSNAVAGNSPRKSNAGPTNAVRTNENEEFMAFYLQEKQKLVSQIEALQQQIKKQEVQIEKNNKGGKKKRQSTTSAVATPKSNRKSSLATPQKANNARRQSNKYNPPSTKKSTPASRRVSNAKSPSTKKTAAKRPSTSQNMSPKVNKNNNNNKVEEERTSSAPLPAGGTSKRIISSKAQPTEMKLYHSEFDTSMGNKTKKPSLDADDLQESLPIEEEVMDTAYTPSPAKKPENNTNHNPNKLDFLDDDEDDIDDMLKDLDKKEDALLDSPAVNKNDNKNNNKKESIVDEIEDEIEEDAINENIEEEDDGRDTPPWLR